RRECAEPFISPLPRHLRRNPRMRRLRHNDQSLRVFPMQHRVLLESKTIEPRMKNAISHRDTEDTEKINTLLISVSSVSLWQYNCSFAPSGFNRVIRVSCCGNGLRAMPARSEEQ